MPLQTTIDPKTGNTRSVRHLRLLLLSPSSVASETELQETVKSIQHFGSLTGGRDVGIVFSLTPSKHSGFKTAAKLNATNLPATDTPETSTEERLAGLRAYTLLQSHLATNPELSSIPLLPLSDLKDLPGMLKKYVADLTRRTPATARVIKVPTSFDLLHLCTAAPTPMPEQTAYMLSDIFINIPELAAACTSGVSSGPDSSSPSQRAAGKGVGVSASQVEREVDEEGTGEGKRMKLRELVGEQQSRDVVDFWREEWTVE
jgi:hypothetical protein